MLLLNMVLNRRQSLRQESKFSHLMRAQLPERWSALQMMQQRKV
ncbi:hypothetical protein XACM_2592 [Xanthomonas euvesicatoria pv. citrumelo F1]|nr:hypothetical protein XACM_2592 [Xanthomonas euvesicatoria pv. citrumelo F1]